jgi:DNA-binding NarL/FixJ family response regulator
MIEVTIVDDHRVVADGLECLINGSGVAYVVSKTYSAAGCRELLKGKLPEVFLLDISLQDGNGLDLCPEIKASHPDVKIIMLTSYGELSTIALSLEAGADGYVMKGSDPEELIDGICMVMRGERFLCRGARATLERNASNPIELTRREIELLQLIAGGYTLPELADRMCLGVNTVRGYRQKLNIKLDAHNTAQLLQNARALQFI